MTAAEVLTGVEAVEHHRAAWESLYDAGRFEPCTSFAWIRAMCETHVRKHDELFLIVLRRAGAVCGLVPLVVTREPAGGLPIVTLTPLMERSRTHSDLLLHPMDEESVSALVGALLALPRRWDVCRLVQILEENPLLDLLERALQRAGASCRRRPEPPSFFLRLPRSFDEYLAARSSKFRNHLKRVEKKLAARGELRLLATGPELSVDQAFAWLLEIEERSWKHAHGTAISRIARQAQFYRDMAQRMFDAGRLHLTFLTSGGEAIAYNLGVLDHGQYAYLKTSYVEALKPLGPATVLRARLIASLIEAGVETFDFPAEPYDWETQWASEHRPHASLMFHNRTWRARGLAWVQRWRDARRPPPAEGAEGIAFANARDLKPPADEE